MTGVFNDSYAATYDTVYAEKNYAAECKAVENLIAKFGRGEIRKMLDLGCGTGRHAVIFAGDGFDVTGVDQSEPMVARARDRAAIAHGRWTCRHGGVAMKHLPRQSHDAFR